MNLTEERKAKEARKAKAILFKIFNNYYKLENDTFRSFARTSGNNSAGTWFHCREEEVDRLRVIILAGKFSIEKQIPRTTRIYQHPSKWMEA